MRSLVVTVFVLALSGCFDPFGLGPEHEITGSFVAVPRGPEAPVTDSVGACHADVGGRTYRTARFAAEFEWTNTVIGRNDLAAFEVTCWFGHDFQGGYIVLTIPNVRSTHPVRTGSYRMIEFASGSWTRREDPGVAWSIASVPELRGRFYSSRSGTLHITHADPKLVRGTFRMIARTERNP